MLSMRQGVAAYKVTVVCRVSLHLSYDQIAAEQNRGTGTLLRKPRGEGVRDQQELLQNEVVSQSPNSPIVHQASFPWAAVCELG